MLHARAAPGLPSCKPLMYCQHECDLEAAVVRVDQFDAGWRHVVEYQKLYLASSIVGSTDLSELQQKQESKLGQEETVTEVVNKVVAALTYT